MRNGLYILLICIISAFLSGCVKDTLEPSVKNSDKLRIALSIGDPQDIQTRSVASDNERWIGNLVVLVFDGGTKLYKQGEIVNIDKQLTNGGDSKTPLLTSYLVPSLNDRVILLINVADVNKLNKMVKGTSTKEDINNTFSINANLNISNANNGKNLPMSGEAVYTSTGVVDCKIYRSIAKIQLALAAELDDVANDVTGQFLPSNRANICWGVQSALEATKGGIYAPEASPNSVVNAHTATDFRPLDLSRKVVDNQNFGHLYYYTPEYPSATMVKSVPVNNTDFNNNRTCMIIRTGVSDYKYYRLDLYDHTEKKYIDIRRNTHITVTITRVKSAGYSTPEEAIINPGSNLEYQINITGDNDNVTISNGQYALSVESQTLYLFDGKTPRFAFSINSPTSVAISTSNIDIVSLPSGSNLTIPQYFKVYDSKDNSLVASPSGNKLSLGQINNSMNYHISTQGVEYKEADTYDVLHDSKLRFKVGNLTKDVTISTDRLKYLSNDIGGTVIQKQAAEYKFTFNNPFQHDFMIQARLSNSGAELVTSSLNSIAQKSLEIPINSTSSDRKIEFWYQYNGEWYDMNLHVIQRHSVGIRFLSVGYAAMGGNAGATKLGTANPGASYVEGLWPLVDRWFYTGSRPGKDAAIIDCTFERYTYYNGGLAKEGVDYKDIGKVLINNSIDILFMPFNSTATPSRVQSQEILDWLDGKDLIASGLLEEGEVPRRGLIFAGDYLGNSTNVNAIGTNRFLVQALGLTSGQGSGTLNFILAKQDDNSVYCDIIYNGPFGDLSKAAFTRIDNDYGWFEENQAFKDAGFIPVFRDTRGKVVIAANAQRRIFFHGETQFFQGSVSLDMLGTVWNANGTYYQISNRGPYPALMGNLMWWLVDRVTLGKNIKSKTTDLRPAVMLPTEERK